MKVVVENIVLLCSLKGKSCSLGPPLAQNLETEECPRYPACNFKVILGKTKKKLK